MKFEISHMNFVDRSIVDLGARTCSCNFSLLVDIPYRLVVVATRYKMDDLEDYVNPYYKREEYELTYGPTMPNKWSKPVVHY